MPFINFPPPQLPWAAYLESLPPGRSPGAQDMFDRWDAPRYICPSRPRNGTLAQLSAHDAESLLPGHCKCSTPYMKQGLQGIGEKRAYLAWIARAMEPEEAQHFYAVVASARTVQTIHLAVIPALQYLLGWLSEIEGTGA